MVNIVENWADIEGDIVSISENAGLPGYCQVEVQLERTAEVPPFPNLAKRDEGEIIKINIKSDDLKRLGIDLNARVKLAVRKSVGQVYFTKAD